MTWVRRLFSHGRLERELDAELSFHVDRLAQDFIAAGLDPAEARRRALMRFGGIEPIKEAARDARGTRWVENTGRDLRYALRMMRRAKGFTAAALLSLALGIGANAGVFSVIQALLLRPLPVDRPDEIVFLARTGLDEPTYRFSHPEMLRVAADVPEASFAGMSSSARMQMATSRGAELVVGQLVTGAWFQVLGVRAAAGRVLTPADDRTLGGSPVAVLSDAFWTRQFGRDPAILGRSMRLNGAAITVVGIAPPGFAGVTVAESIDVWLPATMQQELRYQGNASISNADLRKPWVPQDGIEWLTIVARVPSQARAMPSDAPPSESSSASPRSERTSRARLAPRAALRESSRDRATARARSRLARLAQATSSTSRTAPMNTSRSGRTPPISRSRSDSRASPQPGVVAKCSRRSCPATRARSARAASMLTPGRRRAYAAKPCQFRFCSSRGSKGTGRQSWIHSDRGST